jgi:predicted DNA-binding transcriptional regulator AlpA
VQQYIKLSEAAKAINMSVQSMYTLCNSGQFPVLKIPAGKSFTYRIHKSSFEEWIKQNSN